MIARPLSEKSLLCVNELRLFTPIYLCRAPDIAAVGTIFNVISYDAVSGRESSDEWMRNVMSHGRGLVANLYL